MGDIVKVQRYLDFRNGVAKHKANVKGGLQPDSVTFFTDFLEDTLDTAYWTVTTTNATCAINAAVGGHLRYTSDATDNESGFAAIGLNWEDDKNAKCEARIRLNDVSGVALFFGFSDATSETTPEMPIDGADGTVAKGGNTTNAVGFVVDADYNSSGIYFQGCAAGTLDTIADSGVDWADAVWHTLRVELTPDGYAYGYLDGNSVGFSDAAVTSGTDLCVIIGVANRDASADTVDIDYVFATQDR